MEGNEKENLVLIGAKVKQPIREVIEIMAKKDDRSVSRTVARLLESHPEVNSLLVKTDSPLQELAV